MTDGQKLKHDSYAGHVMLMSSRCRVQSEAEGRTSVITAAWTDSCFLLLYLDLYHLSLP